MLQIDISDKDSVDKAVIDLKSKLGDDCLWALVNNAGISEPKDNIKQILAVNFYGT